MGGFPWFRILSSEKGIKSLATEDTEECGALWVSRCAIHGFGISVERWGDCYRIEK